MLPHLAGLSADQPRPAWQAALKAQETDFIRFVSNARVLVGTVETSGRDWGLEPRDVLLVEAANGKTLWTFPRSALGPSQRLLATEPAILLEGQRKLAALNLETGVPVWQRAWSGGESLLLPQGEDVLLCSRDKSHVLLSLVALKDGVDRWSASVDDLGLEKHESPDLKTVDGTLLVIGAEVAALSTKTGQTLWKQRLGSSGRSPAATVLGDELYFTADASVTKSEAVSGNVVWKREFPGATAESLSPSSAGLVILLRQTGLEGRRESITTLDRKTGTPLWTLDLPEPAQSAITLGEGRLYLTTATQLIGIDAAKGTLVLKVAIPAKLQARRLLDDSLRVSADTIVVARELGVLAVQKRDGRILYAEAVPDAAPFTYDFTMHRLGRALESRTALKKRDESRAGNIHSLDRAERRARLELQNAVNQFNLASLRTQAAWQNLSPIALERQAEITRTSYNQVQVQAAAALVYSSLAGYDAAVGAKIAADREERTGIMTAEIGHAMQAHAQALQKDFYVRPRYSVGRGWSLVLVELKTGRRAEIVLSPDNHPLALAAANLPTFAVDPSGSRIVSKGLGLDSARFDTYKKHAFAPHRKFIYPNAEEWLIPYPSVLCFDLASFPSGQKVEGPPPPPKALDAGKRQLDDQLIGAAFQCDLEKVKSALAAGADINAVDDYGETALMLAAESLWVCPKPDLIELLLQRGADIAQKDPSGWTAADHFAVLGYYWPSGRGPEALYRLRTSPVAEE
jgi:outer membrane protein assembly factor BamB